MVCIPLITLSTVKSNNLAVTVRSSDEEHDCKVISNIAKENGSTKICTVSFWKHPLRLTDFHVSFKNRNDKERFVNTVKNLEIYDDNMEKNELKKMALKNEILRKQKKIQA